MLTGDAMYTIRHLAVDQVRQMQVGPSSEFVESIRRIQWVHRTLPNVVIMTAHDHTEYGQRLAGALADGHLSAETLAWVKSYHAATFDPSFNINPARLPRYVPASDGTGAGHTT